jgi:trimethylguanosine synthase
MSVKSPGICRSKSCNIFTQLSTNHLLTSDRYFHQRYNIFNFYDYDIRMTDDAWFGVTPEPVAM